jgi:ABC-type transport system involved in multi-copper enzyme maturation permease subunit
VIEMVRRFLRQKTRNGGSLVLLGLLAAMSGLSVAYAGSPGGPGPGAYVALMVLAAASVSRDASSGALQMILARPIRRTEYLFGRYLGIVVAFAAFSIACVLIGLLAKAVVGSFGPVAPLELLGGVGFATLWAAQMAAPLVFFSTFLPGYGDVIAVLVLQIFVSLRTNVTWMSKASEAIGREILPAVGWESVFRGETDALAAAGRAVLAATLFLCAAALVFVRREFAYGRD